MSAPQAAGSAESAQQHRAGPVVVGFLDTPLGYRAVDFAAQEAHLRQVPLQVLTAWSMPITEVGYGTSAGWDPSTIQAFEESAHAELDKGVAAAHHAAPDVQVQGLCVSGSAAAALVDASRGAGMVVLGSIGRGGLLGSLLGGVSRQVATHAHAPTVVLRPFDETAGRTVVVGVDGSPDSLGALAFAFDFASRHDLELLIVHTWEVPPIGAITGVPSPEPPELLADLADNEMRAMAEELAGFRADYPDVVVGQRVVRGNPVKVLVESSAHAQMLVVGTRGRGGFTGLLLGSVSHSALHHAACSVAVVRARP